MKTEVKFCGLAIGAAIVALAHLIIYPYLFKNGFSNILYYALICLAFVAVSILSIYFLDKIKLKESNTWIRCIIFLLLFIGWFASMYFTETQEFYFSKEYSLRHQVPCGLYFLAIIMMVVLSYILIWKWKGNWHVPKIGFAGIIAAIQTACMLSPNFISDRGGGLFHIHAYFNPVYNAAELIPYSDIFTSIYGHYTLFYILPVRLLRLFGVPDVYAVMAVTAFIGFLSFIVLYLCLEKVIKTSGLYFLVVFAVSYISFVIYQSGQYYQVLPHRIFFPAIMLLTIILVLEKKCHIIFSWIVSGLAILWNLETGVICLIVCCILNFIMKYSIDRGKGIKRWLYNCAWILVYALITLIAGYLFLNIYNLLIGGGWISVMDYIFPIGSKDYVIEDLAVKLPGITAFYFLEMVIFLGCLIFYCLKLWKGNNANEENVILLSSVMGLGLMTYYMNRAAYANISISHICFVMVIGLGIQKLRSSVVETKPFYKNYLKASVFLALVIVLSFFALGAVPNLGRTIVQRSKTVWDMDTLNRACENFKRSFPENSVAVGVGIPEFYSVLGWENAIPVMEYADFACCPNQIEYVKKLLDKEAFVLFEKDTYKVFYERNDWIILSDDLIYSYCARYDQEQYDKVQAMCALAYEYELPDSSFINMVCMNCFDRGPTDEEMEELEEFLLLNEGELGRLQLGYMLQAQEEWIEIELN